MADVKKSIGGDEYKTQREIIALLVIVAFLSMFYLRLEDILVYLGIGSSDSLWARLIAYFIVHIWPWLKLLLIIVGGLAVVGIYYSFTKLRGIRREEQKVYGRIEPLIEATKPTVNEKWEKVLTHLNSTNPTEWRQAIIEADIMLDELLTVSGYHGDSIGEKLKSIEPSDFTTLDSAWNAHKVRNRIAHDGSDFELNEREAKATVTEFEKVFKEFEII